MKRKRYREDQIIQNLKEAERGLLVSGTTRKAARRGQSKPPSVVLCIMGLSPRFDSKRNRVQQ